MQSTGVSTESTTYEMRIAFKSVKTQTNPLGSAKDAEFMKLKVPYSQGTMEFNDAQTAYWKTHTQPEVSIKAQKLVMLSTIAYDQENAGLHFEGRRSFAEAEVNLLQEQLTQTSQAARAQNPLKVIRESAKNLAEGFANYFGGTPSFQNIIEEYSKPIANTKYKVSKSTALEKHLAAGKKC